MEYKDLLAEYIKKSNMTLDQIAEECKKYGINIHPTYISKLRLGKRPPASYVVTAVLAKVLGGDPQKLLSSGRNEESQNDINELLLALQMVYPDLEGKDLYEKMLEVHFSYIPLVSPPDMSREEFEEILKESGYDGDYIENNNEFDFKKAFEGQTLKWGDEVLDLNEDERIKAMELLKVLFGIKKDT
ncbi:helix-turn-helix transcriptional regulator [Bacillus sp. 03113]|uniref:helix-turn-helix domain-containing protein n=1 Tax=Bacillus sp. 03113 TaxID=2578211 RepID=UPI001141C510|nr:helix-turn-helix transcriptional regulator [Bacillus sp. 03113]